MDDMFFQDWMGLLRVMLVGTLAYAALVAALRVSGKRTLAQLNAFDLVVTVAFGSTLATIILSEKVALAEGLLALVLLIGLQWIVTFSSVRSRRIARLVRAEPTLLLRNGEFCEDAMRRERVTPEEVRAVLRRAGLGGPEAARAVILEGDGSFSVTSTDAPPTERSVAGFEDLGQGPRKD
ncbi:DUF421 domain-containing protein [Roseovarius sp. SCSIO 43702]|uniref:DUF421 domain-containing protein n=1 Tax=Roseovarius sp. SCSIO 43702 TaxID=2823043 RepID=UPI001C7310E4|nr:YetF domain-containing protein [Roseovarius sp. SCSIO 43702]QYX58242.1 DUF421 domain-containing protein [Roseovarius sp. SCSIO 43702]